MFPSLKRSIFFRADTEPRVATTPNGVAEAKAGPGQKCLLCLTLQKNSLFCKGKYHFTATLLLTDLGSTKQVNLLLMKHNQSSQVQTSKTGGQSYSYTSLYKLSIHWFNHGAPCWKEMKGQDGPT